MGALIGFWLFILILIVVGLFFSFYIVEQQHCAVIERFGKYNRITTAGMTKNEIKRAAAAALDKGGGFSGIRVELIITGKTTDK